MTQQQVFEARRRRGAWSVSPDMPGRTRQRLGAVAATRPPSLAQVAGRLPDRIRRAAGSGRLSPIGVGMVAVAAAAWSLVEMAAYVVAQVALWLLLGDSLLRAVVAWLSIAVMVLVVAW